MAPSGGSMRARPTVLMFLCAGLAALDGCFSPAGGPPGDPDASTSYERFRFDAPSQVLDVGPDEEVVVRPGSVFVTETRSSMSGTDVSSSTRTTVTAVDASGVHVEMVMHMGRRRPLTT